MQEITINTIIRQCQTEELDADALSLVNAAITATEKSYAPYSHFHVGAAVMLEDGSVFQGANHENAAYSVCMCAERSAIFAAQSAHPDVAITAIAVAARNADGLVSEPVSPCGVCRQALLEVEERYKRRIPIYMYGTRCVFIAESVKALLPLCFNDESMR